LIAAEYKELSKDKLKAYDARVKADKERFNKEMEEWKGKQARNEGEREAAEKEAAEDKAANASDATSTSGESSSTDDDDSSDDGAYKKSSGEEVEETVAEEPAKPPVKPPAKSVSKKKKDSKKPKGGKNAYNFFVAENKLAIEKANPDKEWKVIVSCLHSRQQPCVVSFLETLLTFLL